MTETSEFSDIELLSTDQAAEYLNINPRTLASWRRTGAGPGYFRLEGIVRYSKLEVISWLKSNSSRAAECTKLEADQ